jgi:predicted RNA binding protein YcfA (HicA-like mRNA interferase family)
MPPRLRELEKKLAQAGISLQKPGSGSHWKFVGSDGKTFHVPAHNGKRTEIPNAYVKALCRCFGLPSDFFSR